MAEIRLEGVTKRFGQTTAVADLDLTVRDGEFVVLLGPTGAGKTTTLRRGRRPGAAGGRPRPHRRRGRDALRPGRARRRLRLPAVLALSALHGLREPGLPAEGAAAPAAEGRDRGDGARGRAHAAHRPQARQPRHAALGRRDAARRHRPRPGAQAQRLPDGRAALLARRQAARRAARRAEAHPERARRHHPLRHARPDRGDDAGRPRRRAARGPPGAGRHAARRSMATRTRSTSPSGWVRRRSTW